MDMGTELELVKVLKKCQSLTDKEFLAKYNCKTQEEFFQKFWQKPDPFYFVWVKDEHMAEGIIGQTICKHRGLTLMKVGAEAFYRCVITPTRTVINGESGFAVKRVLKNASVL